MVWLQLMLVFIATDLLLGIFPDKSIEFWLGIIVIVTFFSLIVAGVSAIFTSLMLRMKNVNTAHGLFTIFIMVMGAFGGNFFPVEQFPAWVQAISEWTPTGVTISLFTELLQHGDTVSFAIPLLKQSGFFILFLLIGIFLFPERGRA
jgi:ABC-2 type transport system permease protein